MSRGAVRRTAWTALGLVAVVLGAVGIVVPGLPTTVFFIIAAACFSRSSPRLEQWVMNLPRIGPMVRDYRAGLGMPRRAKIIAITAIVVFAGLAVVFALENVWARVVVVLAALTGVGVIALRVPTRPRVSVDTS